MIEPEEKNNRSVSDRKGPFFVAAVGSGCLRGDEAKASGKAEPSRHQQSRYNTIQRDGGRASSVGAIPRNARAGPEESTALVSAHSAPGDSPTDTDVDADTAIRARTTSSGYVSSVAAPPAPAPATNLSTGPSGAPWGSPWCHRKASCVEYFVRERPYPLDHYHAHLSCTMYGFCLRLEGYLRSFEHRPG